jgi:hypothetical protein
LPHNLVLIRNWTCFGHGRIKKLVSNIYTTTSNHLPLMVRMMGFQVVTIEVCKYLAFFMVVFPWQTLQLTSSFVVETTMLKAWHFAHSFWRGGVVGFNTNNIPTT